MNQLIEEIYNVLKDKYGISKVEIERITNTQFKVLENNIKTRGNKVVNLIYLGKVNPSKSLLKNYEVLSKKFITVEQRNAYRETQRNIRRLEKLNNEKGTTSIQPENGDMQQMSTTN